MPKNPQPPSPPSLPSEKHRETLATAYTKLLGKRLDMIGGLAGQLSSQYRREVLVDSVISGLIAHFSEFARDESIHQAELRSNGVTLEGYANNFIDNVFTLFTQLRR